MTEPDRSCPLCGGTGKIDLLRQVIDCKCVTSQADRALDTLDNGMRDWEERLSEETLRKSKESSRLDDPAAPDWEYC